MLATHTACGSGAREQPTRASSTEANRVVLRVFMFQHNLDYTTGRPYIEATDFGSQTLSCEQVTRLSTVKSTPENTHPHDPSRVPPQPFVYPGILIQHATRLIREVCALKHLSINTEKTYIHWLGRYASFLRDPKLKALTAEKKMEAFLMQMA